MGSIGDPVDGRATDPALEFAVASCASPPNTSGYIFLSSRYSDRLNPYTSPREADMGYGPSDEDEHLKP
jgi:hypothetical protein